MPIDKGSKCHMGRSGLQVIGTVIDNGHTMSLYFEVFRQGIALKYRTKIICAVKCQYTNFHAVKGYGLKVKG